MAFVGFVPLFCNSLIFKCIICLRFFRWSAFSIISVTSSWLVLCSSFFSYLAAIFLNKGLVARFTSFINMCAVLVSSMFLFPLVSIILMKFTLCSFLRLLSSGFHLVFSFFSSSVIVQYLLLGLIGSPCSVYSTATVRSSSFSRLNAACQNPYTPIFVAISLQLVVANLLHFFLYPCPCCAFAFLTLFLF